MAQIATGDYDMVFMTHEHLGFMKMKPETQKAFLQKELDQVMESMAAAVNEHGKNDYSVKQLEAAALKIQAKIQSSMDDSKKDDTVYFEDSGIDQIMVDEAHYFKNLGVYSKNQIKGIPTATSDRALDMYMRSSWLMEKNNGRGVVFATGTPVSNSMAELYVMQKYLQEAELKEAGINNFDDWANMYGDTQTKQEYTMTGEYKPVTRFSEFTNVPELLNQARQVMDVVRVETALDEHGNPTVKRPPRKDAHEVAPPLPNTAAFLASLQSRARNLGRAGGCRLFPANWGACCPRLRLQR
jgi:N12 class adenine-specific DNA methylase